MAEKKGMLQEFKEFAMKGNVIDLAVGMIIGSAFGTITSSLVNDIIMPLVSMLIGGIDFTEWKWVLKEAVIEDGEVVKAAVSVNFGTFISTIINFIILAFAIFLMVKAINSARAKAEKKEEEKPAEPPAPPEPSAEEKLLTEIRDLLKKE